MAKDYLSKTDRDNLVYFHHVVSFAQHILDNNFLTKEEKTNIKKCVAWGSKVITSTTARLNPEAFKILRRYMDTTRIYLEYNSMAEVYTKKKSADINASYDDNKEYFKLVELIMYDHCRNCTKHGMECDYYKEFERNLIPDWGDLKTINCKYSYITVEK